MPGAVGLVPDFVAVVVALPRCLLTRRRLSDFVEPVVHIGKRVPTRKPIREANGHFRADRRHSAGHHDGVSDRLLFVGAHGSGIGEHARVQRCNEAVHIAWEPFDDAIERPRSGVGYGADRRGKIDGQGRGRGSGVRECGGSDEHGHPKASPKPNT